MSKFSNYIRQKYGYGAGFSKLAPIFHINL